MLINLKKIKSKNDLIKVFERVKEMNDAIDDKLDQLYRIREVSRGTSAIKYDRDCVQTSASGTGTVDAVIKCVEYEQEIDRLTDEYIDYKGDIIKMLQLIEKEYPVEREVLFLRYIKFYPVAKISDAVIVQDRTVRKYRSQGFYHLYSALSQQITGDLDTVPPV